MEKELNYSFDVFEKIELEDRINWNLYVDAVYRANPDKTNLSAEVLSKLLGVKNQGGFRYIGNTDEPKLVILFTSGEDIYWKDELDASLGVLLYYGDNKIPGTDLHKTKLHGNEILRNIFQLATSNKEEDRKKIPPIFVFKKAGGRDVKFLGLAVPGIKGKPMKDWLTAVWGVNRSGDRFQNYKSYFTILNTASGSEFQEGAGINLAWLTDITLGTAYESKFAPKEWKRYIDNNNYSALVARVEKYVKTREEQLPQTPEQLEMLDYLQSYFIDKDRGYSFEKFAVDMTQYIDNAVVDIEQTRPYKDGGVDGVGRYRIFSKVENVVYVEFYLQAKCYKTTDSIKVKDTARLISRIKDRQFGIMFTTSYVSDQAYQEILEDGHPIVIITGKNIIDYIFDELEIRSLESLKKWLERNY